MLLLLELLISFATLYLPLSAWFEGSSNRKIAESETLRMKKINRLRERIIYPTHLTQQIKHSFRQHANRDMVNTKASDGDSSKTPREACQTHNHFNCRIYHERILRLSLHSKSEKILVCHCQTIPIKQNKKLGIVRKVEIGLFIACDLFNSPNGFLKFKFELLPVEPDIRDFLREFVTSDRR